MQSIEYDAIKLLTWLLENFKKTIEGNTNQ